MWHRSPAAIADAMLAIARREAPGVDWQLGDARRLRLGRKFQLVVMTGHAFQVLLTDDDVRAVLNGVRDQLGAGGTFAFETRNPDRVELHTTYRNAAWTGPITSSSVLRFISPVTLRDLAERNGFVVEGWFGDWNRAPVTDDAPEIIVVARAR